MDMKERLQELAEAAGKRISESEGLEKLNEVRVAYLGKKGELTAILKSMKDVAPEERPKVGQLVNETRSKIEALLDESKQKLEEAAREEKMKQEVIDVTLPSGRFPDSRKDSTTSRRLMILARFWPVASFNSFFSSTESFSRSIASRSSLMDSAPIPTRKSYP